MICVLLPHATFGLVVADSRIAIAPPIARWSLDRPARDVWEYYATRGRVVWLL